MGVLDVVAKPKKREQVMPATPPRADAVAVPGLLSTQSEEAR